MLVVDGKLVTGLGGNSVPLLVSKELLALWKEGDISILKYCRLIP